MGRVKLNAEVIRKIAETLRRGSSFKFAVMGQGFPSITGRYWLNRGRLELEQAEHNLDDDVKLNLYATFAREVDMAMGEAVRSASERAWRDNPTMWLRYSYARTEFYPVEARAAAHNAAREQREDERALQQALADERVGTPPCLPEDPAERRAVLLARGTYLAQLGKLYPWSVDDPIDKEAVELWMTATVKAALRAEGGA